MNRLSVEERARILGCLVEGNSMRATSRMCDVSVNTVTKLLVDVGTACDLYQNEHLRNLRCKRVQVDEIWSFVGAKQKNLPSMRRGEFGRGDVYTWVAIDADTKLVPSWLVGQCNARCAHIFINDLRARLAGRIQLTSDGHKGYLHAVEEAFGDAIDFAMLVKLYGDSSGALDERRTAQPNAVAPPHPTFNTQLVPRLPEEQHQAVFPQSYEFCEPTKGKRQ